MALFHDDADKRLYLEYLRSGAPEFGVTFLAWVLMDNHVHFIAVPETVDAFTRLFSRVNKDYADAHNRKYGRSGKVFQERRRQSVLDEPYFIAATRYVNRNPPRAGMVATAGEYDWSSARFLLGEADFDPLVATRRPYDLDLDWRFLLEDDPSELGAIRRCTNSGSPMGSVEFIRRVFANQGFEGGKLEAVCRFALKQLGVALPPKTKSVFDDHVDLDAVAG